MIDVSSAGVAAVAAVPPENTRSEIGSRAVVVIDTGVEGWESLRDGIPNNARIVLIQSGSDGLQQIATALEGWRGVSALHLLAHGRAGAIQLGDFVLDSVSAPMRAAELATIRRALAPDGDFLIYSCEVAKGPDGVAFLSTLAQLTGADVSASDNLTGAASLGGDWTLEFSTGSIENVAADVYRLDGFRGLLATPVDGTTTFGNLDEYPASNVNAGGSEGYLVSNVVSSGWDFRVFAANTTPDVVVAVEVFTGETHIVYGATNNGFVDLLGISLAANDGKLFDLNSVQIIIDGITSGGVSANMTLVGYRGGSPVAGASLTQSVTQASSGGPMVTFDVSGDADFDNIDSFRVVPGAGVTVSGAIGVDNVSVSNLHDPNTTPVLTNLNGDSVAWAGIGNTVTLDSGGNASLTDAEFGALNGGNGDWSGGSLAVQRSGTAISSDTLGFNTSGALFSVNGSNLQSGGQTFATFTNTGGVLTISFTSSATTATTALVNDVAQRISYRNDTPAGDATLRFTLSDGTASTTADVSVTSNTIYVTNSTDTATINISNGVSFSEAVAIAAADATGSQTIVFSGSLAATALTINSVSLNESLTFDMDAASSMSLTSGTVTLGAATTQSFTLGTGDTATISGVIAGSGSLTKSGAGGLTLSATNTYSGATTVSAGTLTVSGGDAISNNSSVTVASGATLALSNNETIGNLSGAGAITLGSNTLTSIITADTTFSGDISGTGGLSVSQSGAATFALTLSGSNTYTGNTIAANFGWLKLNGDASVSSSSQLRANGNSIITLQSDQTVGSLFSNNAGATIQLASFTLSAGGDNTSTTVSGVVSGSGNLVKQGSGTLTLAGANTYNGATTVSAGALSVASDSNLGSNTVTLAAGSTLEITGATNIDNAIALAGNATISNSAGATLSGVISGANTLTKAGASALTLSGTNTYAGTTVSAGALSVAGDANLGSGSIALESGATLAITGATNIDNAIVLNGNATVSNSANATLSGVISGANSLSKSGASTLTLSGSNTYSGATTVSAGTLSVASDSNLGSGSVNLANGATLAITGATTIDNAIALTGAATVSNVAAATLSGVISGDNLSISSATTLTLTGANTYTGVTNVTAGTLAVGSDSNLGAGSVNLANASALSITNAVTIDNAVTLTGVANIGTPAVAILSGVISGGSLTKIDTGSLTLSAANTYSGVTNAFSGTLIVNGSTAGTTTVYSGATLAGSGTLGGAVAVQSGGTLSPGASPGALTINGDLTLNAGSTLAVEINGATAGTQYDQVIVNGAVNASGATLSVNHGYTAGSGDSYTIIVNDGADAVTGAFSGLAEGGTLTAGGNGTVLTASYVGSSGNDFTLSAPISPAVTSVSSISADSTYKIGDSVIMVVNFSEAVFLSTGTIQLMLETGATDRAASYLAGSGSSSLYFTYTVQDGDISSDLDFTGTTGLVANGDTIQSGSFIDANLTLPSPGAAGSIAASKDIVIDGVRPTASIVVADTTLAASETSMVTITFNEAVTGLAIGDFTVANGALSSLSTGDGGITWTATLTPAGAIEDATNVITLDNTGVTDAAGNTGTGTTDSNNYAVDTIAPVNTVPAAQATTTVVPLVFSSSGGNAIAVSESGALTTVVSVGAGTLTATTGGGAVITNNGTAAVTIDGTAAEIAAALEGLIYTPDGAGAQTIAVQSADAAGNTDNDTIAVTVSNTTVVVTSSLDTADDATTGATFAADQADGGGLSIREALYWVRAGDAITFDLNAGTAGSQGGTITLGGSQLTVTYSNLTIDGDLDNDGTADVTISGNNASRVMIIYNGLSGIELKGLTLTEGLSGGGGAGLSIAPNSTVTVRDSNITNNTATTSRGGGVYGTSINLTLINSTVSGNTASVGGGIGIEGSSTLYVLNSTVSGNRTTSILGFGGGIYCFGAGVTIVNSTISGNRAPGIGAQGGGLAVGSGTTFIYNSTIVGNACYTTGGGVAADGTETFVNTVVAGNMAGASSLAGAGGSPLATGGTANDVSNTLETATNCYFGSNVTITTNNGSLNNQGTNALLLDNLAVSAGGTIQTHRPQVGSALRDAGSNAALPADTHDVDGDSDTSEALPLDANGDVRISGSTVDIGAVEVAASPVIISVSSSTADGAYKAGDTIAISVVFDLAAVVDTTGGTPTLLLETGATDRLAAYVSGSGTTALAFTYTVQAGDTSPDLDYASTGALALNGATIRSGDGIDAILTLPAVGGASSLAGQKAIVIDTTAPVVTSGSTATAAYRSVFGGYTITASGDAVSFGTAGLPAGLSVDAGTGAITGTPTQAGNFNVTLSAIDAAGNAGTSGLTLTVTQAGLTVAGVTVVDRAYNGATNATLVTAGATLVGVLGGDDVSLVTSGASAAFADANAGSGKPVTISGLTLGGAHAAAYTLTQPSATATITKANQTVSFSPVGSVTVGSPVALSATASSGLGVTFSVVSGSAAISGATFTANDADPITLRATQSGNANYHAASSDQTIASNNITKLPQTITFAQPADHVTTDAAFTLNATASSGLTVSFTVESGPATISGSTLTLTGAPGAVTVVAAQAGNAAYTAAPSITRSFAVTAPAPLTYFGEITNGATVIGGFAGHLSTDGSSGILIGYLPSFGGGFVVNFAPGANGSFTAGITPILQQTSTASDAAAPVAAASATWTFRGQIVGNTIVGSIDELALAFGATADPVTGSTAAMAGYYNSASLDTTDGVIHSIVGTTGTVYVLAITPDLLVGAASTIDATNGDFVVNAASGVSIDGNVQAATNTVDGAIIRPGGAVTEFAGVLIGTARTDRLINLSSRARVGSGESLLITGFVIGGAADKPVLIRAVGPGLNGFDIGAPLANPRLRLFRGAVLVLENDDWGSAANHADLVQAMSNTGAFDLAAQSKDAAILVTLSPGLYTALIDDPSGAGVALAEIYDASSSPSLEYQRLVNISTRGYVGPGEDALIGGFVVTGNAPKRVLIRGVGPKLGGLGVVNPLSDPTLTLYQGSTSIAQNTDWGAGSNTASELAAAATATGAFALDAGSKDAAILITLAPGAYTVHVTSATSATGVALVEVYEAP